MGKSFEDLLKMAQRVVVEANEDAEKNPSSDEIQIVVVEPEKKPYKKTIKNELEALQKIVDGYIQILPIGKTATDATLNLVLNEEGRIKKLPFNRIIVGSGGAELVVGTFFISSYNKQGDNVTLNDKQCDRLIKKFSTVEVLL